MRLLRILAWTLAGVVLSGAIQWEAAWTKAGMPGLNAALPTWAPPLLPLAAPLLFGLFLTLAYGGRPGAGLGLTGALAALAVAGMPLLYAYGWAQRLDLPAHGFAAGALLAGPLARSAAAAWLAVALIQALRPARTPAGAPARTEAQPMTPAAEPASFWSPAPQLYPPEAGAATAAGPGQAPAAAGTTLYGPADTGRP